ncbi:M48 family metalloprotease [Neptuniibacter caesariensis]|uniref:Putative Zn-dependent protease containing TPR repeats n=1 Tax=Neptuniibacter caesariensis TaxID=207954 RepID=A0A7U8C0Z8_NEPCE|nr:M48 family metalloprotease [Neptuniibacter caesariensis]EAR59520.1 putative Zn-dependent protease containing TPR repeats [Oceanospirillum sp. MED92] [Neptuniibacter caesariensis]
MWNKQLSLSRFLLLTFVALWVSGCQVNNINLTPLMDATKKSSDLFDKSLQEEVELGQEISLVLLKQASIYNVREVQHYVSSVGGWLAQHTERAEIPWRFVVVRDDRFNAFATPGGYIYITTGTLSELNSESELAGILAHEIAHVVQRHHLNAIRKEAQVGIAADLARFVRDSQDDSSGQTAILGDHSLETKLLNSVQDIYSNGLARGDELEADTMGMVIAARAGYDPMSYISVLQKIDAQQADTGFWKGFTKRHPPASERLEALEKTALMLSELQGQVLTQRYKNVIR